MLQPLAGDERERYYAESHTYAAMFGLTRTALPPDWPAFMAYNEAMWQSNALAVTPTARAI